MTDDRQLPEKEMKMMFIEPHNVCFQKNWVRGRVQEDEVTAGRWLLFLALGFSVMSGIFEQ